MSNYDLRKCDFCRRGRVMIRRQNIAFRQWTDKGYICCEVSIPIGICQRCGAKTWDEAADAIIADAVRQQYDKLP
jgi:hypothetical protein